MTPSAARSALVIGAGQIGMAIADRLLDDGWRVTVATRGQRAIPEALAARATIAAIDHGDAGSIGRAVGDGVDALIDTIAYEADDAGRLIALEDRVGTFVVISSVSVYADAEGRTLDEAAGNGFPRMPVPITEQQATVDPGPDTYSTRKRAMECTMLDRACAPVIVVRPSAVHGPESRDPREYWFVKRLLDGRDRIPLAYGGASRFQTSATVNIAAVVTAALDDGATRILNAVDPDRPSVAEIGSAIMAAVGRRAELVPMPLGSHDGAVGMTPWSIPRPFVLSDAAARAIGYRPVVDYATGVRSACRWLVESVPRDDWAATLTGLAKYSYDMFDYAVEDRWLASR